jgi:anti-sigma regulatory factor (Ser/Thr protein kinase)
MIRLQRSFSTLEDLKPVQEEVLAIAEECARRLGLEVGTFSFRLKLILEEGWVNHLKHGNEMDPEKVVTCEMTVAPQEEGELVVIETCDEGKGFLVEDVPDATETEYVERACGRGVLIIQGFAEAIGGRAEYLDGGRRLRISALLKAEAAKDEKAVDVC